MLRVLILLLLPLHLNFIINAIVVIMTMSMILTTQTLVYGCTTATSSFEQQEAQLPKRDNPEAPNPKP